MQTVDQAVIQRLMRRRMAMPFMAIVNTTQQLFLSQAETIQYAVFKVSPTNHSNFTMLVTVEVGRNVDATVDDIGVEIVIKSESAMVTGNANGTKKPLMQLEAMTTTDILTDVLQCLEELAETYGVEGSPYEIPEDAIVFEWPPSEDPEDEGGGEPPPGP